LSVLVPPGTYTVKLVAGGQPLEQQLTVRKDPNTAGSDADIQAQTKAMLEIRDTMNEVARVINQAESIRVQLAQMKTLVADDEAGKAVKTAADDLDARIVAIESHLFNIMATGRGQDMLRTPSQMVEKLSHLADVVGTINREKVKIVATHPFYDDKVAKLVAEKGGAQLVAVPLNVGGVKGADDVLSFFNVSTSALLKAAGK